MKFKALIFSILLAAGVVEAAQTPLYVGRFTGNGSGVTNAASVLSTNQTTPVVVVNQTFDTSPGAATYTSPLVFGGGSKGAITSGMAMFNGYPDYLLGIGYNTNSGNNGDIHWGLGFEHGYVQHTNSRTSELYLVWNNTNASYNRRVFQANVDWGNNFSGSGVLGTNSVGYSTWFFDVNELGIGNGQGAGATDFKVSWGARPKFQWLAGDVVFGTNQGFTINRDVQANSFFFNTNYQMGIGTATVYENLTVSASGGLSTVGVDGGAGNNWIELYSGTTSGGIIFSNAGSFNIATSTVRTNSGPTNIVTVNTAGMQVGANFSVAVLGKLNVGETSGATNAAYNYPFEVKVGGNQHFTVASRNSLVRLAAYNDADDTPQPLQILGAVNASTAAAGMLGEVFSSAVASGSAVVLATATTTNVTSISLTAGDWDVSGNINIAGSTATYTQGVGGTSTTSVTLPTDGTEVYSGAQFTLLSVTDGLTVPRKVVNVSSTTTVYLVAKATFSAGTMTAFGSITARRIR